MFKMMENGELIAADIFPAVAREMKKVANAAGALEQKYKTTRVAQGRFFKELEKAQNTIFEGGFDKAIAEMFNFLARFFKENQQTLKSFGKLFESVFSSITALLKFLMPFVGSTVTVFSQLTQTLDGLFGKGSSGIILGIYAMTRAMRGLNRVAKALALKFYLVLAVMDEIFAPFIKGRVGALEKLIGEDLALGSEQIKEDNSGKSETKTQGLFSQKDPRNPLTGFNPAANAFDRINSVSPVYHIYQSIKTEIPAGANEEEWRKKTKEIIYESNQLLLNNAYPGGE